MSSVPKGLRVRFTQFDAADSLEGQDVDIPWNTFATEFVREGFHFGQAKSETPLMVPVEFVSGATRKSMEYVDRVYIGALDYDELTEKQFADVLRRLVDNDLEAIVYTTWGHPKAVSKGLYKFRVLVPLSRPVEKAEWKLFWPLMNGLLGSLGDRKCFDPTRGYFVPAVPKGTRKDELLLTRFEGKPLDVNQLLSGVDTLDLEALAVEDSDRENIDRDRIRTFAKKLIRSTVEYRSWMGSLLLKVLKGEPFAEKGNRDNTVYKLAKDLGEAFPEGDAASLAQHFEASLSHMGGEGAPTVAEVRDKISRAQKRVLSERLREQKKKLVQERRLLEDLGEYSKETIESFCSYTGCGATFDVFFKRLIVQKGSRFFVFCGSDYVCFTEKELTNACRDLLMPAAEAFNVSVYNVSDKGVEVPKSVLQLVHDYGVVAHNEEVRIYEQASYYEEATKTFVEAPFPLRALEPKQHPAVDRWIDALCPRAELAESLRDWMAVASDLRRALAFLVFVGQTGVGKTSFADCIARLWTTSKASKMANAFDSFNTEMKRNPVLLADEGLPTDYRGRVPTDKLRSLISSGEHVLNSKHRDLVRIKGYYRLVAAVNGLDKVSFGQVHTREDVEAIQQRTLIIPVEPKAAGFFDYDDFFHGDAIAEHSLWLRKEREKVENRFGIRVVRSDLFDLLQDDLAENLLSWLLWFLENRKLEDERELPAFVAKNALYANSEKIPTFWESLFPDERKPNKRKFEQTLKLFSDGFVRVRLSSGTLRRYWRIRSDLLRTFAVNAGHSGEFVSLQLLRHTTQLMNGYAKIPAELHPTAADRQRKRFAERSLQQLKEEDPGVEEVELS